VTPPLAAKIRKAMPTSILQTGSPTILIVALTLAACSAGAVRQVDVSRYDLGPLALPLAADSGVAAVEVIAPSWLGSDGMEYRLAYADAGRRLEYAESRWAAPPAELLRQGLQRQLAGAGRCRLRLDLDEFVQVFDSPQAGRLVLESRATLFAGQEVVARKLVAVSPATPSADAKGGVAAAAAAVRTLGDELAAWLVAYAERCRG
jgi:cholesterol transport system auxiliary component